MSVRDKNIWILLVFILSGLVIGGLIGDLTAGMNGLDWLSYGQSFGLSQPVVLDLNIINLTFRNSLNYNNNNNNSNNNQLKQQDSLVSFYNSKNNIDEIQMNTINSLDNQDNEINDKKEILNLEKFEKSIDEINQKLSIINKVIINNLDFKTNNEKYLKLNSNNNFYKNSEKEVSEFNISENDKTHKNNSMAITNNYYDGSYINTINNFSNNSMEKLNYLDIIKNDKSKTWKACSRVG